jgi:hypothetical protein
VTQPSNGFFADEKSASFLRRRLPAFQEHFPRPKRQFDTDYNKGIVIYNTGYQNFKRRD